MELPSVGDWVCYILQSKVCQKRTYVGMTNNMRRRLRQHNGEIKGGAMYTTAHRPGNLVGWIQGFSSRSHVSSFEYRMHRRRLPSYIAKPFTQSLAEQSQGSSVKRRLRRVDCLLLLDRYRKLAYKVNTAEEEKGCSA